MAPIDFQNEKQTVSDRPLLDAGYRSFAMKEPCKAG